MKFSQRLHWDTRPNRLTELLSRKRIDGAVILDLTESNPTNARLDYPAEAILQAFADSRALRYEPTPKGMRSAREAIAVRYGGIDPERIILTASTSEAYSYLFKLLCDPEDEVLAPRPSYPLFEFLAALDSVRVVQYPLFYHDGWMLDAGAVESLITPRTRAIIIVNPNNPTGSYLKEEELNKLASFGLPIISDEVFSDYPFSDDAARVSTLAVTGDVPSFSLSGLSKVCGLPQMKLGWIIANGSATSDAPARLELIADTFLSVGSPVQLALPTLLASADSIQQQIRSRTASNLQYLREQIRGRPVSLLEVEGGWYATLHIPRTHTEEEWVLLLLEKQNTLVQPGFFYDFDQEAFLVLSLLTPEPAFREGINRLNSTIVSSIAK
jgi:aspartate/methionine/tyrosine aminotransferase